jgi:hypothetical protein
VTAKNCRVRHFCCSKPEPVALFFTIVLTYQTTKSVFRFRLMTHSTEEMHVVWLGRLPFAKDASRHVCHIVIPFSSRHKSVRGSEYTVCANIHVIDNVTYRIRCIIRPNPKLIDISCYITWYQFMWQAAVKKTHNNSVQIHPTPSVNSNVHHIAVDDECLQITVLRIRRESHVYLKLLHSPLWRIPLSSPSVI